MNVTLKAKLNISGFVHKPDYANVVIFPIREGSLITCDKGVEDILIYLIEFSIPLSDIGKHFWFPHEDFRRNSIFLLLKCSLFFIPPSL